MEWDLWVVVTSVAAAVAAITTIVIAYFMYEQVNLTKSSLKTTQTALEESIEANRADIRAYVTVKSIKIIPQAEDNRLMVSITNSGRTPALDVRFSMKTQTMEQKCDPPELSQDDQDAETGGVGIIAGGQTHSSISDFTLGPKLGGKILRKEKWIVTRCVVTYKDIFGRPQKTEVLSFYNPETEAFQWCPEGNVST